MKKKKHESFSDNDDDRDHTDEILAFVKKYGTRNKDLGAPTAKKIPSTRTVNSRGQPRETIDLHGMRSEEASQRLRFTVHRCVTSGVKELLIIHGVGYHSVLSGGPVLKDMVRSMLENELCLNVRDFRNAVAKDGGDGATLVYLR
jgi:DNA-nicking Smr family endonuclease